MTDFTDPSFTIPVILGILAVLLAGYALWRQKQDRSVAKATFDLLRTMRKELRPTPAQSGGTGTAITSQQELRKREQLEWRKLRDVAKAIGWVWDRMGEDDDDE